MINLTFGIPRRACKLDRGWTDPLHPKGYSLQPGSPRRQAILEVMFALGIISTLAFCSIAVRELFAQFGAFSSSGRSAFAGLAFTVASVTLFFSLRWLLIQVMVIRSYIRSMHEQPPEVVHWPFVSILVPGFNEAPSIQATVRSLLTIDYPNFEILVLDDGSTAVSYTHLTLPTNREV